MFERITDNDLAAVSECLAKYGAGVWSVAKKHSHSPLEAEQLTVLIFHDIWKWAHRFKTSGMDEAVFIALIARRRVDSYPVLPRTKSVSNNRFADSFRKFANGDGA